IGVATQVLARALVERGHHVRVSGIYPKHWPAPAYQEDAGVGVWRISVPRHRLGWLHARHRLFTMIARWARAGEIDLVEVPDWEGLAAWWPGLPVPVVARLNGSASYFGAELGRRPPR